MDETTRPDRPELSLITAALFLFPVGTAQAVTAAKAVDQGTEADDTQIFTGTDNSDSACFSELQ